RRGATRCAGSTGCPAHASPSACTAAPKGSISPGRATGSGRFDTAPNMPPVAPNAKNATRPSASAAFGVGATAAMSIPTAYIAADARASTPSATPGEAGSRASNATVATTRASATPPAVWAMLTTTCATSTIAGDAGDTDRKNVV